MLSFAGIEIIVLGAGFRGMAPLQGDFNRSVIYADLQGRLARQDDLERHGQANMRWMQ
ncbi:MAG: hypothetical protein JNK75_07875 [Betaproteobacteria bacterium]|nr:hypothetical protein [Betaproteobacteria bacterium]